MRHKSNGQIGYVLVRTGWADWEHKRHDLRAFYEAVSRQVSRRSSFSWKTPRNSKPLARKKGHNGGELARFTPTIVPTDEAQNMKFMHGMRPKIVKQVDSEREWPESNIDAVQRALRNDGWDKKEEKSTENKSTHRTDGRRSNNVERGQSSLCSRSFRKYNRFDLKKQNFSSSDLRPKI